MAKPPAKTRAMFTRKQFAAKFARHFHNGRAEIMAAGRTLNDAKAALEHGEFEAMVEKDLPVGPRSARTLMAIAADPRLSKRKHASVLPVSARALHALTRLSDETYEKALKNGDITPDTTEADARRLKKAADAEAAKEEADKLPSRALMTLADLEALAGRVEAGAVEPFRAIVADPPWEFETWSDKGRDRSPDYQEMPVEEICAMADIVRALAAEDCVLFLWGLNWPIVEADIKTAFGDFPKTVLPAAAVVMRAWGFDHVTKAFAWVKQNKEGGGLHRSKGAWTWGNIEDCWLGKRGKPKRLSNKVDEVVTHPAMEHSRKPGGIHLAIEQLVRGPYLELFARRRRKGWTVWGNEIEQEAGTGASPDRDQKKKPEGDANAARGDDTEDRTQGAPSMDGGVSPPAAGADPGDDLGATLELMPEFDRRGEADGAAK